MDEKIFVRICKRLVAEYVNENIIVSGGATVTEADIYVVWLCKALQNSKALLSTTLSDGMYYELTFNGDKNEIYLDAYKKVENKRIEL